MHSDKQAHLSKSTVQIYLGGPHNQDLSRCIWTCSIRESRGAVATLEWCDLCRILITAAKNTIITDELTSQLQSMPSASQRDSLSQFLTPPGQDQLQTSDAALGHAVQPHSPRHPGCPIQAALLSPRDLLLPGAVIDHCRPSNHLGWLTSCCKGQAANSCSTEGKQLVWMLFCYRAFAKEMSSPVNRTCAVRHKEQVSNIKVLFNKYVNSKRRTMENTGQIRDGDGHLTIKDEEEAEVFHALFASFFNICDRSWAVCPLGWRTTTEEQWHSIWPYMGPDVSAQCLSVWWDLPQSTEGAEPPSTIHQRSWEPREVPVAESWTVLPWAVRRAWEDPGSYRPICPISVPGEVTEPSTLGATEKSLENKAVIRHSQHRFITERPCLGNVISCYHLFGGWRKCGGTTFCKQSFWILFFRA